MLKTAGDFMLFLGRKLHPKVCGYPLGMCTIDKLNVKTEMHFASNATAGAQAKLIGLAKLG